MATQVRHKAKNLYDEDFYVWTEAQAELMRKRQFEALDLDNLIEEVEALGRAEKSSVLNNTSVIIEHLLKLQYSPAQEPRNAWRAVREHRRRLRRDLTPPCARSSAQSCRRSMRRSARIPRRSCGIMERTPRRTLCRLTVLTLSIRSPATGGHRPPKATWISSSDAPARAAHEPANAAQIQPASSRRTRSASSAM
jgi:hypothetical protein